MVAWDDTVHSLDAQKKHEELHAHTHTRTHARKELGHWSDPMGTESRKRAIKQDYWSKVGVLGLAPCHVSEKEIIGLQVRPAGQAGYPISPVASLDTVPEKCCVPPLYEKRKTAEVLHLFRCYTHTHLTDRLSSMSHFLFPIKGSGYSDLRPF